MSVSDDDVLNWFGSFKDKIDISNPVVKNHIVSLTKYHNNQVANNTSKWRRIYTDCLTDIGYNPNDTNKLEIMSKDFIAESGKKEKEDELNQMTKKEFVILFAETMGKIKKKHEQKELEELEEKEEEKRLKEQQERLKEEQEKKTRQESLVKYCQTPGNCINEKPYDNNSFETYYKGIGIYGGQTNKKSRKRRIRRRNRRATIRKYKNKNKNKNN